MPTHYDIGDLVYLDNSEITGIIIDKLVFGDELFDGLIDGVVDVEVQWIDGTNCWRTWYHTGTKRLTIISKADTKKG